MKNKKNLIWIVAAVIAVAALVTAIVYYRKEIADLIASVKEKLTAKKPEFTPEECEDFADI